MDKRFELFGHVFKNAFYKFPITVVLAIAAALLFILNFFFFKSNMYDPMGIIQLIQSSLAVGMMLSIAVNIFLKGLKVNNLLYEVGAVVVLMTTHFLFNYFGESGTITFRDILIIFACQLLIYIGPFISTENPDKARFWKYVKRVFLSLLKSRIYAVGFMLLIVSTILIVQALLNKKPDFDLYYIILASAGSFLQMVIFAHLMPTVDSVKEERVEYGQTFRNIATNILYPFILIQTIFFFWVNIEIIIDPGSKIEMIALYYVLYLVLLMFMIVILHPIAELEDSEGAQSAINWLYKLIAPVAGLVVATSIFKLIKGSATVIDFFSLYMAIWMFVVYFNYVVTQKSNLRFLLITLTATLIICAIGPQNIFNLTEWFGSYRNIDLPF